jgi:hypothetical protein
MSPIVIFRQTSCIARIVMGRRLKQFTAFLTQSNLAAITLRVLIVNAHVDDGPTPSEHKRHDANSRPVAQLATRRWIDFVDKIPRLAAQRYPILSSFHTSNFVQNHANRVAFHLV